jgi:Tol biopolymer transport system component
MLRMIPLLAALVLAACAGGDGADVERDGGEIAFSVNRAGWNEIWLMDADGSERRRLTEAASPQNDAAGSMSPAWSPDGTEIAFAAQIGTRVEDQRLTEIYVMKADGTDRRRLTTNADLDADPTWSPDGTRIAFTRLTEPGTETVRAGIFVMDAHGGHEVQVTHAATPIFDLRPAWSPDGSLIAFTRGTLSAATETPDTSLYVVAPEGAGLRRLTADGAEPDWSPDGTRIAFTAFRDGFGRTCFHDCSTSGEVYVMNADGSDERRLTESEADDRSASWSPDGRSLAFVSDRSNRGEHQNEIYVMTRDGGDVRPITRNRVWDLEPDWGTRPRIAVRSGAATQPK